MKKKTAVIILMIGLIIAQAGCAGRREPVSAQTFSFDTVCSVLVYDMDGFSQKKAEEAIQGAFALCRKYELLFSRTREETEISLLNGAGGAFVDCSPETVRMLRQGMAYQRLSDGRFCLAIGRLTGLWDFHEGSFRKPEKDEIEKALIHVDTSPDAILFDGNRAALKDPEAEIDAGGIAKGFIADAVSAYLEEQGVTSAIVNLGGNIVCIGEKKRGTPFTIGIELPFSDRRSIVGTCPLKDATIVTSGVYERCFEENGILYHHVLDPATGYPAETDILGVSVYGEKGRSADCDALATICLLLGQEEGMKLIEASDGFEAVFIAKDGSISVTDGMAFSPAD